MIATNTMFDRHEPTFKNKVQKYKYRTKVFLYDVKKTVVETVRHLLRLDKDEQKILQLAGIKERPNKKDMSKFVLPTPPYSYDKVPEETLDTMVAKINEQREKENQHYVQEMQEYKEFMQDAPPNIVVVPETVIKSIREEVSSVPKSCLNK